MDRQTETASYPCLAMEAGYEATGLTDRQAHTFSERDLLGELQKEYSCQPQVLDNDTPARC